MRKLFVIGNGVDWCSASLQGLTQKNNVYLINDKFPLIKNKNMARIHFSYRLNRVMDLPFKSVWFKNIKIYISENSTDCDEIVLLVYDWNFFGGEKQFVNYIRKECKNVKLAYVFTNIVKRSFAFQRGFVERLNEWYDIVFAFDPEDAKILGFKYSPLIYDPDPNYNKGESLNNGAVFYVGQAKDRLPMLLACFARLKELGIKRDFHIANVPQENIKYADEIEFNRFMTYGEAVDSIKQASCLIDIVQGESIGLTIKVCEAVGYQKKLITTNKHLSDYPFYDSRYMLIIDRPEDIQREFFENNKYVDYSEEAFHFFSGERFWNQLWSELKS